MAYRMFGAKPSTASMLNDCHQDPKEHTSMSFNLNTTIFFQENVFINVVCKMASIFVQGSMIYNW